MARGDIFIVPPKVEHQVVRLEDAEIISCEFSFDHFFPPKENSAYQQVHEAALNLSFAWLFLKDADDIHSQFSLRPETGERVNTLMNAMLVEYENGDIYYEEFLRVQIMELLLVLAREYSQSPQSHTAAAVYDKYKPMVEDAIRYVEALQRAAQAGGCVLYLHGVQNIFLLSVQAAHPADLGGVYYEPAHPKGH